MHPEELNLYKYFRILRRYWLPGALVWSLTIALALVASLFEEDVYQASGKLLLKKKDPTTALITTGGQSSLGTLEAVSKGTPLDTEKSVLLSSPIIEQTIDATSLVDEEGQPQQYQAVIENLSVKNEPGTDILVIAYEHNDQDQAKEFVNNLMAIYIDNNIRVNRAGATAARDFISQQLPKAENDLLLAESAVRLFKETNNLLNLNTESGQLIERLGALDDRISQIKAELFSISGRVSTLEVEAAVSIEDALALNILNQEDNGVQKVLERLQTVQDQLAIERTQFTDESPVVIDLENKRLALEAQLNNRIAETLGVPAAIPGSLLQASDLQKELAGQLITSEVRRQGLLQELDFLEGERVSLQQRSSALPGLEQQSETLNRQLQVAQSAYETLVESLQRATIAENQDIGNAEVVSPAIVPLESEAGSSLKKMLVVGFAAGAILYIVTAFICHLLDPRFRSAEELSGFFKIPLLGEIPFSFGGVYPYHLDVPKDGDISHLLKTSMNTHMAPGSVSAYRAARDEVRKLLLERNVQIFAVSSLFDSEGKSTIAANLAASISELGCRVLLIDAHPTHASQGKIWNQSSEKGLTEILLRNLDWKDCALGMNANLDLLLAGPSSYEASLLWGSERMRHLLGECRAAYDYVILDSPSMHQSTDVMNLARMVDGILLVSSLSTIDSHQALAFKENLDKFTQYILGIIVNQSGQKRLATVNSAISGNHQEKVLEYQ